MKTITEAAFLCVCVCVCLCGSYSGGVIAAGLLQHSPWVKGKVKTNELPIRESLSERDVYFCLSSLFLLVTQSALLSSLFFSSPLFASHSLSRCCPRRLFCWHNRLKHTHSPYHTQKIATRSWEQRGVTGQKSHTFVCLSG